MRDSTARVKCERGAFATFPLSNRYPLIRKPRDSFRYKRPGVHSLSVLPAGSNYPCMPRRSTERFREILGVWREFPGVWDSGATRRSGAHCWSAN